MTDEVLYELREGIAWVTLNRPHVHNALNAASRTLLTELTARFAEDTEAHVMILTGAGPTFCAGADLKEMAAQAIGIPAPDFIPQFGRTIAVNKPIIAAVNGDALAGGFLLAQNCDLVIAVESARFGISEIKWSRGAPWAIPLPQLIPPRIAMQLLLTGDPIDARRAYEVGLVNTLVTVEELLPAAELLAQRIAANPSMAVHAAKQTVALALSHERDEAFRLAEELWAPVYSSQDALEGPRAFREKRAPRWIGA